MNFEAYKSIILLIVLVAFGIGTPLLIKAKTDSLPASVSVVPKTVNPTEPSWAMAKEVIECQRGFITNALTIALASIGIFIALFAIIFLLAERWQINELTKRKTDELAQITKMSIAEIIRIENGTHISFANSFILQAMQNASNPEVASNYDFLALFHFGKLKVPYPEQYQAFLEIILGDLKNNIGKNTKGAINETSIKSLESIETLRQLKQSFPSLSPLTTEIIELINSKSKASS